MINTYLLVHEYRSQGGPRSGKVSGRPLVGSPNVKDLHSGKPTKNDGKIHHAMKMGK